MTRQATKTVHILKAQIDDILDLCPKCKGLEIVGGVTRCTCTHTHQADAIIALYKLVFPDWENIEMVDGFPECNRGTWKYIAEKFQRFDAAHHPNVMPGGIWLNNGWSAQNDELREFEIAPCPVKLRDATAAA